MSTQPANGHLQPQFVSKPAFTVVGLLLHTKPMAAEIPPLWDQFVPRMGEIQGATEPGVSYGLMDHLNLERGTMDYMAGIAVEKADTIPAGMTRWDVRAATYAVFETTLPQLGDAFGYIYNTWLPASGNRQAAGPYFERYSESFHPETNPVVSIYIPVEKS